MLNDSIAGEIEARVDGYLELEPAMQAIAEFVKDGVRASLKEQRLENLRNLLRRAAQKLSGARAEAPPLAISVPLLESACDESREDLVEIWAGLLAVACDPSRRLHFRRAFVEIASRLEPFDVAVLPLLASEVPMLPTRRQALASRLRVSEDEIELSFRNLQSLGLISRCGPDDNLQAQPSVELLGRQFLKAIGRRHAGLTH